jgi:mTERF domain-containing protein, mitochondrial
MLRLRSHLLSSPLASAAASLHRLLLSTAAPSPTSFIAEEFLVTACGLTPSKALRASRHLAHLKSPSKPEAVLAFFADVGLAKADVAAAISRNPSILCCSVDVTLTPRFAMLRDMGLSPSQISRLVSLVPNIFRSPSMISQLPFYMSLLGSYDKVHTLLRRNFLLLGQSLERVVKPNMVLLQQCGLSDRVIAKILLLTPRMFGIQLERFKEILLCAEKLGVPPSSTMFKNALRVIHCMGPERIDANLKFLKKELGCSEAELGIMVHTLPNVLTFKEVRVSRLVNYLKTVVGLETEYIVHRPALLCYSMKARLMPRRYVLKVLQAKGLVKKDIDFYNVVCLTEKRFVKRYLDRFKEDVPGLAGAYAEQVCSS